MICGICVKLYAKIIGLKQERACDVLPGRNCRSFPLSTDSTTDWGKQGIPVLSKTRSGETSKIMGGFLDVSYSMSLHLTN